MTDADLLVTSSDVVIHAARLVRASRRHIRSTPPAGVRVLSLLDEHGPSGVGHLADLDGTRQPTMSGTVSTLVGRGWVTKKPDPQDARATLVTLTDAGRAALAVVRRRNAESVAAAVAAHPDLTTEDLATTARVLRLLLETPTEGRPDPA